MLSSFSALTLLIRSFRRQTPKLTRSQKQRTIAIKININASRGRKLSIKPNICLGNNLC